MLSVEDCVAGHLQAVGFARQLVQLCAQAGRAVTGNELYKAYCLLKRAQNDYLSEAADPTQ